MSNEHEHADSPALLPCPFCGSEPVMRRGGRYGFWALCQHCGAALRMSDTEADAARNWNRRSAEREVLDASTTLDASALRKALAGLVSAVMDYHENAIKYVGKDMMQVLADPINRAQEALCSSGDSGNAAAMREALELVVRLADDGMIQPRSKGEDDEHCFVAALDMARAAIGEGADNG